MLLLMLMLIRASSSLGSIYQEETNRAMLHTHTHPVLVPRELREGGERGERREEIPRVGGLPGCWLLSILEGVSDYACVCVGLCLCVCVCVCFGCVRASECSPFNVQALLLRSWC